METKSLPELRVELMLTQGKLTFVQAKLIECWLADDHANFDKWIAKHNELVALESELTRELLCNRLGFRVTVVAAVVTNQAPTPPASLN